MSPPILSGAALAARLQFSGVPSALVSVSSLTKELVFRDNVYDSGAEAAQWFSVDDKPLSFEQWTSQSGEQGAKREAIKFPDPGRSIETYMKSLGKTPTFDAFITEVLKQSKTNWRKEFSAPVVNDWIRDGFAVKKVQYQ